MLGTIGALAALGAVGGAAAVRLAPTEAAAFDVDPAEGRTGPGRYLVAPGGDREAVRLDATPLAVLERLDAIAAATPRTERLVWRPEDGRATWVTRSRVVGFPDFTSVRAVPDGEGSLLTVYARLRYGYDDMGVNRARVNDWLNRLGAAL